MDEALRRALRPVFQDIVATGAPTARVEDRAWDDDPGMASATLWGPESGRGVSVTLDQSEAEQVAWVTDQVQEWLIDQLWLSALPTNWPPCPWHPDTHPMIADVVDDAARWLCPTDRTAWGKVGEWRSRTASA